jgi:hypothetical protein
MTKEIEVRVAPEIESKNIQITPYGVEFLNKPTIEEWHKAVLGVQKVHGMMQFYLGDLMVFAESPVTGWGESKYQDLMDATGYEWNTLHSYATVARRFTKEFRKDVLNTDVQTSVSFEHFVRVASLDDVPAKHFLEMVRDSKWTISKLRDEVAKYKNGGILPEKAELPEGYKSFREQIGKFFKGFTPEIEKGQYDEKTWLLEVRETIDERLQELGIINE